jgi:integrase/recombinase XerD
LDLPRRPTQLPQAVLSVSEVEQVIMQPDTADPVGVRDRAILETLYSTGIRRMELISLLIQSVDRERGTLIVRQGKGRKDRVVPIGDRALEWVERYVDQVRPMWVVEPDPGNVFLTKRGAPLRSNRLTELVHRYVTQAGIGKTGSCHLFRHTMATLMLEGGADIRYIQEMLGHAQLTTTELYTRVSIERLKEVHERTHPAHSKQTSRAKRAEDREHDELFFSLAAEESDAEKSG